MMDKHHRERVAINLLLVAKALGSHSFVAIGVWWDIYDHAFLFHWFPSTVEPRFNEPRYNERYSSPQK